MRDGTTGIIPQPGPAITAGPAVVTAAASSPVPQAAPVGGLGPEQMQALQVARWEGRKVARAATVAAFSGWTLATFAVLTLLSGIFSLPALLLGIGMAYVARTELRGSKALKRLETSAPKRLAVNQLVLAALLVVYGGWGMFNAFTAPSPYEAEIAAGGEVGRMLEPIAALHLLVAVAVYGGVMGAGVLATGCTSLYYYTRSGHLLAHLERTPDWIVETLRAID